ncbi:MAG: FAD-binding protein [Thermoflexales bacterium]|nr:FAD-binding protein [Thermoflexales bacterium]
MDSTLVADITALLGPHYVVSAPEALTTYDADACVVDTHAPDLVVLPRSHEEVEAIVRLARKAGVPVVARGAGTGLAGGATPIQGGLVIATTRMDRILEVDVRNSRVRVQPGVLNFELSQYLKSYGYQFAPDPSSQKACTIGGNIANNAGGPHCLKYGFTASHVLGVRLVLPNGESMWTGDGTPYGPGYDLTGIVCGSEGMLGVVTEAWLRMTRLPEAVRVVLALFPDVETSCATVSQTIASGFVPSSLEIMDALTLKAVNGMYRLGLPEDAGAALLIEVDGVEEGLDTLMQDIEGIARRNHATEVRPARTAAEQTQVWAARKNAFGAMGRLAPTTFLVDTVVPRSKLPAAIREVQRVSGEYHLPIANVFHAGDGNLHPLVLFDRRVAGESARALEASSDVITWCVEQGGTLSGEHGIGLEKQKFMTLVYSREDLAAMAGLRHAFDPAERFNPGKVFPQGSGCGELAEWRRKGIAWRDLLAGRVCLDAPPDHDTVGGALWV